MTEQYKNDQFSFVLKSRLLEILHFFLDYCKNHNLRCYGCGGTVLGAVRHQGFIPWDDDIDIYMPREDYDCLMGLNQELQEAGYSFVCLENDSKYYLPFGKLLDTRTSIWEVKRFPYMLGVYIDIFPLDYFEGTDDEISEIQFHYLHKYRDFQYTLTEIDFHSIAYNLCHCSFSSVWKILSWSNDIKRSKLLYGDVMKCIERFRGSKGEKCVCATQWIGKIFKAEWFENCVEMPFEDLKIMVPSDYDSYLTLLYGDYMTPPPERKRVATHADVRYYTNLKERVSIEQAKERVSRGETLVY